MRTGRLILITYDDDAATVTMVSPRTQEQNTRVIPGLSSGMYESWLHGNALIQEAMPHVSTEDREFLMTGYTPEDWAAMFPADEGDTPR